jgi:hypothetical protein
MFLKLIRLPVLSNRRSARTMFDMRRRRGASLAAANMFQV